MIIDAYRTSYGADRRLGIKSWRHFTRGPRVQSACRNVDHTMDVVQRQHIVDAVGGRPLPGLHQVDQLRIQLRMGRHNPLHVALLVHYRINISYDQAFGAAVVPLV
jgi:hypothetical protein